MPKALPLQAGLGFARRGGARPGQARQAGPGVAGPGPARQGRLGGAGRGQAGLGRARQGTAGTTQTATGERGKNGRYQILNQK